MTDHPQAVMLFAAGFGTRMGDLTKTLPKPMIEVAGAPLIDHALDLAYAVNPARIVCNLHYLAPILAAHLAPRDVLISDETERILDTGGGLKAALPLLGSGPVYTMNTDAIWSGPNPLTLLTEVWNPAQMDALLMCVPVSHALGHDHPGDFQADPSGRLSRGPGLVYGGVQIVKTDALQDFANPVFSLNALWDQIHGSGRLYGLEYPGKWCDVGHPGGIALAEELIASANV